MKTSNLFRIAPRACAIATLLFFNSCSSDAPPSSVTDETTTANATASRTANIMPFNGDNVHDLTGELYSELLSAYYENVNLPTSIVDITDLVEHTAAANSTFTALKTATYQPTDPNRVAYLYEHSATSIGEALEESGMSPAAQSSLKDFIRAVLEHIQEDELPVVIYEYIIAYEEKVIGDSQFSAKDKDILLTTTSITRHSAYFRKKRPKKNTDPDWDWLSLSIAAAAEGAGEGRAEAITMSLACGVVENR